MQKPYIIRCKVIVPMSSIIGHRTEITMTLNHIPVEDINGKVDKILVMVAKEITAEKDSAPR